MKNNGFTLIELIIVIIILGILSVTALPRFIDLSSDAKISVLDNMAGSMKSTISLVQMKARATGLKPSSTNPGGIQTDFVIDFGFGEAEVHFSNLCPESIAEFGSAMNFFDFMEVDESFEIRLDNQYSLIGYDVPSSGTPTNQGCYIIYDSFATPNCTVEIVKEDC